MNGNFKRVFIAFESPIGFREIYADKIYPLFNGIKELKTVIPENIHITLKFLGSINIAQISEIKNMLSDLLAREKEINVKFTGIGAFPNVKRPRVVWAGFDDENGVMEKIAEKIDLAVSDMGFEKEKRPFRPHITIARVKKGKIFDLNGFMRNYERDKMLVENFKINMVAFYESILKQDGPVYKVLQSYPLKSL